VGAPADERCAAARASPGIGGRLIFHQRDQTIRGHVFCTFLALVLRQELDPLLP
jgi:hypothetical protein